MSDPAEASVQNLLPVQAYFGLDGSFQTFIGQGQPFFATVYPYQSGLHITDSTIDSTIIGGTTPSAGTFTNVATTTGTISSGPVNPADIANKQYVDQIAAGLSVKAPVLVATTADITLSGNQTIDGVVVPAGSRVLVKNQSNAAQNGIYVTNSSAWARASDMSSWSQVPGAFCFVQQGLTQADNGYVCVSDPGGTIGVTPMNWVQFAGLNTYTAGTGLQIIGNQFSIANTGVTSGAYGSASSVATFSVNAQGQLTLAATVAIAIAASQITSGTISSSLISGNYSGITGVGTLLDLTVTNPINGSITGNAATATTAASATTSTNLTGGSTGAIPYQTAAGATTFLASGTGVLVGGSAPSYTTTPAILGTNITGTATGLSIGGNAATATTATNLAGGAEYSVPYQTASGSTAFVAAGTSGYLYQTNGGGSAPSWVAPSGLTVGYATNISGGVAGAVPYQSAVGTTGFTAAGTTDQVLLSGGTGSPTWANQNTLSVGYTNNLNGGATGSLPYQTNSNATGFIAAGTNGYVLTMVAGSPAWAALPATGVSITDDTTTNATRYLTFTSATSGNITTENVSSTKLQFNPSTGTLTASSFSGAGTGLTGTASGLSIGGNAATATTATSATSATTATNIASGSANQIVYQTGSGATSFITAPSVSGTVLQWNGSAFTWAATSGSGTVTSVDVSGGTTGLSFSGGPITTSGTITASGTLIVANGGTGATTLTGYVYGNGTGAMTASTTIPNTAITGLGTLSTQNANNVAITGGAIDGTTIGATTASTVTGTTITATSQFTGAGTGLTGTASSLSIGGNAATATLATSATTASNLAGGAAGSVPYQTASGTTTMLAAGTNGYVLTMVGGVPAWAASTGGVTSFQTSLSGLTPSTSTTGAITLAGTLGATSGGTSQSTYATGDILYASATNTLSKLAAGTNGYVLTMVGGVPAWQANSGSSGVSSFSAGTTGLTPSTATTGAITLAGTLVVSNGGTGLTSLTAGYIPYGNGTSAFGNTSSFTYASNTVTAPTVSASNGIYINSKTVSASYSIPSGSSAMSAGPITVASGQSVTIPSGSKWVVL